MQAIIHYPETETAEQELLKKVSTIHATEVFNRLKMLSCSIEQAKSILNEIYK